MIHQESPTADRSWLSRERESNGVGHICVRLGRFRVNLSTKPVWGYSIGLKRYGGIDADGRGVHPLSSVL